MWIICRLCKFRVNAAARDQFGAAALLDDPAVLEHDDLIHVMNGGEAVGDDQGGAAVHQFLDRFHDGSFGRGVERGSGFVEKQDRRVFQKGARDPDALALADAEMSAAFADLAVVAVGKLADEFVGLRAPGGIADLLLGRVRPAVGNVLADGGGKEKRVLQDDGDLLAQRFLCDLAQVAAIERDDDPRSDRKIAGPN